MAWEGSDRVLQFVATARQQGPIGYRDPRACLSPDGSWVAFSEGLQLRARRLEGGPVCTLGPRGHLVTFIAWLPDSKRLVSLRRNTQTRQAGWWIHSLAEEGAEPLWPGLPHLARLRELAWQGEGAVALAEREDGSEILHLSAEGRVLRSEPSQLTLRMLAVSQDGRRTACSAVWEGVPRLSLPAGAPPRETAPEVYGALAFSPDGALLYYATPGVRGTLDLWSCVVEPFGSARRLTRFARDTHSPSAATDGRVLFAVQDYRANVAAMSSDGGAATSLCTFQSEVPRWAPDGRSLGLTYGRWRRSADDYRYPDIDQSLGVIRFDPSEPAVRVEYTVRASESEDQGMDWSPDARFVALHSHAEGSDDIWIAPADLSRPAQRASWHGRETGWPRWSPDGRWIAFETDFDPVPELGGGTRGRERGIVLLPMDAATGGLLAPQVRLPLGGFSGRVSAVEWAPDGERLFFASQDEPGCFSLWEVPRAGGKPRWIHGFESEQLFAGLAVSPRGDWLAYVAPARDGFYQIFRIAVSGGEPVQLSCDPSHKAHPAISPDGQQIALTVWSYECSLWLAESAEA